MLTVVEERALVESPDGVGAAAGAAAPLVPGLNLGEVIDGPAGLADASAQIGVLEVHEEPLVERPHLLQRAPPDDHAGPGDPVHRRRAGQLRDGRELLLDQRAAREETVSSDVRPSRPETMLNSLRAESWTRPSASRTLGPAKPTAGFSSKKALTRPKKSPSTSASGFTRTSRSPEEA